LIGHCGEALSVVGPSVRPINRKESGGRWRWRNLMHIDCGTCTVRGAACSGCVVTVLLGMPDRHVEWDDTEQQALNVLAASGLVPPLRLVTAIEPSQRQAG